MKFFRNKIVEGKKAQDVTSTISGDQSETVGLVKRAAGGDLEAFGELYNIYVEPIYRYVFHQVKDRMTAEDVTEDVFIKAWKAIGSCEGKEQTFLSWLYRIAHNHIIDNLRRQRKYLSTDVETVAEPSSPEFGVEGRQEQQEVLEAISELPQNQKQVIILKFIEGLDNKEIGEIIGKSQGAVRVLQMRALATLRGKMGGERQGDGD